MRARSFFALGLLVLAGAAAVAKPMLALRALSRIESRLAPRAWRGAGDGRGTATCTPVIAAHRGYWQKGRYPQNSRASLGAARSAGIRNIEIDVIILADSIVLDRGPRDLPPRATLNDYRRYNIRPLQLDELFRNFSGAFDRIVFDVKQTHADADGAVAAFRRFPLKRGSHYLVGLDCDLLRRLQQDLSIPAGCERLGVVGNTLRRFELWSANVHNVNSLQLALNRWAGLTKLFWTYDDQPDVERQCHMSPDMALVTFPDPVSNSGKGVVAVDRSAAASEAAEMMQPPAASGGPWSRPAVLGWAEGWFPDIAADSRGDVHTIWARGEGLAYRLLRSGRWTPIADLSDVIAAPQTSGDLVRAAVAVDRAGTVHLLSATLGIGQATYVHSVVLGAGTTTGWTNPHQLGVRGAGYYCALATDSRNRLHALYVERPAGAEPADTFYRRSDDGGLSWSEQVNLSNSPNDGSSRPQIIVDAKDRIHVGWDEGWDRITGHGRIDKSIYRWSSDAVQWSPPIPFGARTLPSAQLVVTSPRSGTDRLAIWRSSRDEHVYFQTSRDEGVSWTQPRPVPDVNARTWNSPPFDQYALSVDPQGRAHLAAVGRQSASADVPLQLLHVTWDGAGWSRPEVVFQDAHSFPEYPRIAIGPRGLHLIWFTRSDLWESTAKKSIWYSEQPASATAP